MSPGQRRYIERRIAQIQDRAVWLRHHCKTSEAQDWHHEELAGLDARIAALQAKLGTAP